MAYIYIDVQVLDLTVNWAVDTSLTLGWARWEVILTITFYRVRNESILFVGNGQFHFIT